MAAGELLISPNMGGAVMFITIGFLGLECLCMCRWNVQSYISRGNGLTFLVDACLSHHEAKMGNS